MLYFSLTQCLVSQVTTLVNTSNKGPSSKKKGRSKKAHVLAVSVEQATQNFLEKGEQIAKDSQDLKEELIAAVEDVRKQGKMTNKLHLLYALVFSIFLWKTSNCYSLSFFNRDDPYYICIVASLTTFKCTTQVS